ncbi:MAPEG family protein [Phanerochaete sordida]|uniref:MAPEG family protein n=1 Tax=Phanerochaete sordida TaxID=48140 RepID=A0A9P3FZF4_9APHY|nr:MAPEG family protein [Phanerochaete sordida]
MNLSLDTPGLALYSIPAVWATAFYPNVARWLVMKNMRGYTNVTPRENMGLLKDSQQLDESTRSRLLRMAGAHQNGMENLPIWFAAVLSGYVAGVPHDTMNRLAGGYLALRLVFNYVYFNHTTETQSHLRTFVYFAGLSLPLTLLIKSANKLSASAF